MIQLHVEPRVTKTWDDFIASAPANSMALDGYVAGPPAFSPKGPHVNLNHHEGVDRLATRSTAAQVLITVKQGLFDSFRANGGPFGHVFVNDADQDTSLSVWLLRNQERIAGVRSEPLISRLVFCSDMMDATAGAYPFSSDAEIVRELAWIYQPYEAARQSGHLSSMNAVEMETLIDAVGARISAYSLGKGQAITPNTGYSTRKHWFGISPKWEKAIDKRPEGFEKLEIMFLDVLPENRILRSSTASDAATWDSFYEFGPEGKTKLVSAPSLSVVIPKLMRKPRATKHTSLYYNPDGDAIQYHGKADVAVWGEFIDSNLTIYRSMVDNSIVGFFCYGIPRGLVKAPKKLGELNGKT